MAKSKVKDATVPIKGEKKIKAPKASVTARAKPSQLSEENVLDSGSESESGSSGGGSDTESEAERRQNTKKADARKVKVTEPEEPAVPDDTSSEEEDDEDESGSEPEGEKAKAKPAGKKSVPQTNGTKRKADESSSEEDESDDELPDAPVSKKAKTDSEGPSDEEEAQNDRMEVDTPTLPPGVVASSVPAQAFQPPTGYISLNPKGRSALLANDLQGKQIWHITAPSNVPLSSLTEVALDAIQSGKPVLTHEEINYVLSEDKTHQSSSEHILVPGKDGYAPLSHPVLRSLYLRQHVQLPNLSSKQADQNTGSNTAANVATAAVIGIRPQPHGMKMRYKPPGFGSGDPGRIGSDPESEDESEKEGANAVFQFPKKIGMAGEPPSNPTIVETPKTKKDKKDKEKKSEKKSKKKEKAQA